MSWLTANSCGRPDAWMYNWWCGSIQMRCIAHDIQRWYSGILLQRTTSLKCRLHGISLFRQLSESVVTADQKKFGGVHHCRCRKHLPIIIARPSKYYQIDQSKEDKMGGEYSTHGRDEKFKKRAILRTVFFRNRWRGEHATTCVVMSAP